MATQASSTPEVAFVVCHHRGRLIDRCLASVVQTIGVTYETVVLTSDATYTTDQARQYFVEGGPAHKRNVGVTLTRAPVIVFLDDDTEISPYCAYEFWKFLQEHPKCAMGFAKIFKMEEGRRDEFDDCGSWLTKTGFLFSRAGNYHRDRGQFDTAERCLASKSASCAVRRNAFTTVGGFDRDYFILGEETDLAWRCWLKGWEVWYVPMAVSWHAFGCETLKPKADYYTIERTMTYGCRNYLSLLWTNLGSLRLATIFPLHLSAWLLASMGFCLRGDYRRGMAVLRGLHEFVGRLPTLLRKRCRVQSTRTRSDRELFRHIHQTTYVTYYLKRLWRYWTTQLHG